MKRISIVLAGIVMMAALSLTSCVSTKKFNSQVSKYDSLKADYNKVEDQLRSCLTEKDASSKRVQELEQENANLKASSGVMLKQLSDLSVISATQAESINKSLENIGAKDAYIKDLQYQMSRKDSLNMALVMNLKGALKDVNDQDVQVKVEGSAVLINLSDKMLFKSGKYNLTPEAKNVLSKVAQVINAQPDIQFMVEGNTDNKPIKTEFIKDNWDLSVLRATAVARTLQTDYGVDPKRIIAAGRGEYHPIDANDTDDGRSKNRRTSIIILPQLDQFFKLLEPKKVE
ncbi:MAG: OmpA family protein [Bacteroidetes bacterium]|nr:OmpA family protein [Bacteroidota bacterium]